VRQGRFGMLGALAAASVLINITPEPERVSEPQPWHGSKTRKWIPKRKRVLRDKRRKAQKAQRLARRRNRS